MKFPFQLISGRQWDVAGFGTNAIDYLIRVAEYPTFDSKVELMSYVETPGGEVASTIVGLQRLGFRTAYIGRFGGDRGGELGVESLRKEGVDVSLVETVSDARTQVAFIIVDDRSGERTVIWQRDNRLGYTETDAPVDAVPLARVLHMTPHDTLACIRLARIARKLGVIVSIDVDNIFTDLEELLPLVDVCITSSAFCEGLLGIPDTRGAMHEMEARFGCGVIGVTLGAAGSLFLVQGTFIETPGFGVPGGCADTTGAGDAFRAGFLYGLLNDRDIQESARIANAVAALKCRGLGARTALPSEAELQLFLSGA